MRRNRHHALLHACLLAAAACALPAAAQTLGEARSRTVYAADYFEDIAPANALDMGLRVPGLTIVDYGADVHRYTGGTGHVMFDGARPTSKRERNSARTQSHPPPAG